MSQWIDIPAQRVLCVTQGELRDGTFERCGDEGAEPVYVRQRDKRVFRYATMQPGDARQPLVYLSEV